jgi:hypothetical protein
MRIAMLALVCACSGGEQAGLQTDANVRDLDAADDAVLPAVDNDHDGLDDAREQQLAEQYLPYVSLDPDDGCPRSGMVARVRKHPADPTKILIVYSHLFENDCGLSGHVGDNEAFGIAIDPAVPAPGGILAIKTASHQNTPCERDTECSTCAGDSRPACDRQIDAGAEWPVLYASKDKHGQYAMLGTCTLLDTCFDQCVLDEQRSRPPVVNVGEPTAALVHDLTAEGFITATNGWTASELMNVDPWDGGHDFGGAGNIADDLQDTAFVPAVCP